MNDTTIVIGAGITGLAAADKLHRAGRKVVVLEASNRPGGRIIRLTRNGDAAEGGAQGIHSNYREMLKLVASHGLARDLIAQSNVNAGHLDRQGAIRYPRGLAGLAGLMGARGARDLAWFVTRYLMMAPRFSCFETHRNLPAYDNVTAAEALSWAGDDFRDFLLRPAAHAMAGTTLEHTNLYHFINVMRLTATTKVLTLRNGNVTLAERIAQGLTVRYETPVAKILAGRGGVEGVLLADGQTLKARHVIVACPVDRAARMLPADMQLSTNFLSTFPHAPLQLVYLFLDRPLRTEAYVYLGHAYRDTVFNMALNHTEKTPHLVPSGKAIISAWSCYPDAPVLAGQSDAQVIAQALRDMDAFFPGIAQWVEEARVQRHEWGFGRMTPGMHAKILQFKREVETIHGISFAGNDYDGIHMESGVRGGLRAAQRALDDAPGHARAAPNN